MLVVHLLWTALPAHTHKIYVFSGHCHNLCADSDRASRDIMRLWTLAGGRYKAAKVDRQVAEGLYSPWDDLPSESNQVSSVRQKFAKSSMPCVFADLLQYARFVWKLNLQKSRCKQIAKHNLVEDDYVCYHPSLAPFAKHCL